LGEVKRKLQLKIEIRKGGAHLGKWGKKSQGKSAPEPMKSEEDETPREKKETGETESRLFSRWGSPGQPAVGHEPLEMVVWLSLRLRGKHRVITA